MGGGKTLCEILTVADAMSLSMAGSRVDGNLSSMVLCGRPSSEAATVPGADCHSAVAMPPPCKPFWSKNHAIRPCTDAFQGIHTPVIYQPLANCAPIASLSGYRNPTVCILLKETAQDRAVQVGTGEGGSKISRVC